MSFNVWDPDGDPGTSVAITCVDHPRFEGSRQTQAYLDGCLGCRAVYAFRKARRHISPGRTVPDLRVEVDNY